MKIIKLLFLFIALFNLGVSQAQKSKTQAKNKIKVLNKLIKEATTKGIDVSKEELAIFTAETFLEYADWDESNYPINLEVFKSEGYFRKRNAEKLAKELPDFERNEVSLLLEKSISTLKAEMDGAITRKPTQNIDWSKVEVKNNTIINTENQRPIFLSDWTWKPGTKGLKKYYGDLDIAFVSISHVINEEGKLNKRITEELETKSSKSVGRVFFNHLKIPQWMTKKYPDFTIGKRRYTGYDIDHPFAREIQKKFLGNVVPMMAGKQYTKLGYLLTNEPHWFTVADTWDASGVSNYTIEKFKIWLAKKHGNIEELNRLWGTKFKKFDKVDLQIPISQSLKGTPIWYDWATFNQYRVTEWFKFLNAEVKTHDPKALTHLKIMTHLWSEEKRDHGIDLEALTDLTGIIGNDAGSHDNKMGGKDYNWSDRYSFMWNEVAMSYDFMKSVSPNKINFNSEAHYLSRARSRDLYQKSSYVRSSYWLAFVHGMNSVFTWYWFRKADGSLRNKKYKGYPGSNAQQPRVTFEVASTVMDVNAHSEDITALQQLDKPLRIFYSKTSAILKKEHMADIRELYEGIYFEGMSIGFTTEKIIKKHNNTDWQAILITKTPNVTLDEFNTLQGYLNRGGIVVMDKESLLKNEYGEALPASLIAGKGTLIILDTAEQIAAKGLALMEEKNKLPKITLQENNTLNLKGCSWRAYTDDKGRSVISIVNLGKGKADLTLGLRESESEFSITNLMDNTTVTTSFSMEPQEVLLLEIK